MVLVELNLHECMKISSIGIPIRALLGVLIFRERGHIVTKNIMSAQISSCIVYRKIGVTVKPVFWRIPEDAVHPHYAISWRNNWMLKQSDYIVTYITHAWGGAYQYAEKAMRQKKVVINL